MADVPPIHVPLVVDLPSEDGLTAISDQMGKIAMRWHSLAIEMSVLARIVGAVTTGNTPDD